MNNQLINCDDMTQEELFQYWLDYNSEMLDRQLIVENIARKKDRGE